MIRKTSVPELSILYVYHVLKSVLICRLICFDVFNSVSFRSGLGNSLYCPSHKVGSHGTADLATFTSKHFTSGR